MSTSSLTSSLPTVIEQDAFRMTSTPNVSPVSSKKKSSAESAVPTSPVARRVGLRKITQPKRYINECSTPEMQKVVKMVKKREPKKAKTVEVPATKKVKAKKATKQKAKPIKDSAKDNIKTRPRKIKLRSPSISDRLSVSALIEHPVKKFGKFESGKKGKNVKKTVMSPTKKVKFSSIVTTYSSDGGSALVDFLDKLEHCEGQASTLMPTKKGRGRKERSSSFTSKQADILRMVFDDSLDPDLLD